MSDESEDDVKAISAIISALKPLDQSARVHVLEFVIKRLGISLTVEQAAAAQLSDTPAFGPTPPSPSPMIHSGVVDIRNFAAEKNPKTINEKVAVVGYYLAHLAPPSERRDYLISDDIKTYFVQADFHLPTAPANMTLQNAKNAGYLNALDRGQYKLNAVGYNLVAHKLPGGETGGAARKSTKHKTRAKAKK
jgi:hypothetical protein